MAASTPKDVSGSATQLAAEKLRALVLRREDGEHIGGEAELLALLGVSRPTFRQVAKLLEQEQLLTIRRGAGGGFFARRPSSKGVAHVASIYLYARQATLSDTLAASRPIFVECVQAAARQADASSRKLIEDFLAREEASPKTGNEEFFASEREFRSILAQAARNPVLELFMLVLTDFPRTFHQTNAFEGRSDRLATLGRLRKAILQAIRDGDPEVARIMALRRYDQLIEWFAGAAAASQALPLGLL